MTGMVPPVVGMNPDDMLRMYAERNRAANRGAGAKSPLSRSGTPAQRSGLVDTSTLAPAPAPATRVYGRWR
ncbi:hypothetical protein VKT23_009453 [Stygiomarasmius scandens]|uniref:Uncharacterized protein n=1 Tax=Marasmiellus scandens TaxID=2682957 RepID=A0ABR1JJP7_9AGAR